MRGEQLFLEDIRAGAEMSHREMVARYGATERTIRRWRRNARMLALVWRMGRPFKHFIARSCGEGVATLIHQRITALGVVKSMRVLAECLPPGSELEEQVRQVNLDIAERAMRVLEGAK